MLTLNSKQVRFLRSSSHALNPVVMIGNNGLSGTVLTEIDRSLDAHELIKIQVAGDDRNLRLQLMQNICSELDAAPVQLIGKQIVVYRPAQKPRIILPKD